MTEHDTESYEVKAREHPCPICSGTYFEWGVVSRFTPMSYRRGFRLWRSDATHGVKARHCLTCDHIQLFADEALAAEQFRAALGVWLLMFLGVVVVTAIVVSNIT